MIEVLSVEPSSLVETAGAVDADVEVDGVPYSVTLVPSQHDGSLAAWGSLDHWISGPSIRSLSGDTLDEIVAHVRAEAARITFSTPTS